MAGPFPPVIWAWLAVAVGVLYRIWQRSRASGQAKLRSSPPPSPSPTIERASPPGRSVDEDAGRAEMRVTEYEATRSCGLGGSDELSPLAVECSGCSRLADAQDMPLRCAQCTLAHYCSAACKQSAQVAHEPVCTAACAGGSKWLPTARACMRALLELNALGVSESSMHMTQRHRARALTAFVVRVRKGELPRHPRDAHVCMFGEHAEGETLCLTEFGADALLLREYVLSGLCALCQAQALGAPRTAAGASAALRPEPPARPAPPPAEEVPELVCCSANGRWAPPRPRLTLVARATCWGSPPPLTADGAARPLWVSQERLTLVGYCHAPARHALRMTQRATAAGGGGPGVVIVGSLDPRHVREARGEPFAELRGMDGTSRCAPLALVRSALCRAELDVASDQPPHSAQCAGTVLPEVELPTRLGALPPLAAVLALSRAPGLSLARVRIPGAGSAGGARAVALLDAELGRMAPPGRQLLRLMLHEARAQAVKPPDGVMPGFFGVPEAWLCAHVLELLPAGRPHRASRADSRGTARQLVKRRERRSSDHGQHGGRDDGQDAGDDGAVTNEEDECVRDPLDTLRAWLAAPARPAVPETEAVDAIIVGPETDM